MLGLRYFHMLVINLLQIINTYLHFLYFMFNSTRFFKKADRNKFSFSKSVTNLFAVYSYDLESLSFDRTFLAIDLIKIQELTFLSEYFLITALFCLTLFALFTLTFNSNQFNLTTRFQYDNQMVFLQIYVLVCYLILVLQQSDISLLGMNGFNDLVFNDPLAITSKLIIGVSSILYLMFITKYLKYQKLNNFEYYIILLTSIFGFFLLCCANDFITAYLAIELQGLAFYVLASFKKSSNFSVESGIKYFVLGSLSTALFLFGITFVYGLSGSILLTDFKDFFIWVFSANSFFLGFSSISQALEVFQEKVGLVESSNLSKLNLMSEKLNLLGINAEASVSEFDNFVLRHDFFAEFLNAVNIGQLDYENFVQLKNSLINSNYYEDEGLESLYGLSNENSTEFSNVQKINTNLIGESCFDSIYGSLKCWHLSNYVVNFSSELNNDLLIESGFENFRTVQSYISGIVEISNINTFFASLSDSTTVEASSMFNLDFAIFGFIIIVLALFFKLALAPFHLWSPDVYEGSPSSSTFFFMVLSKFGIFVFLLRLCYFSFYSFIPYWQLYSIIVASISVFIGSVAGLKQRKLKSLLTYSSINNMGFVLLAFSVGGFEGIQVKFYYLIVYILASVCIWSIILNLQLKKNHSFEKQNRDLGDLALLQESNSILAQNLGITLFSLAGLPPMVGFLAKMGVFKALSSVSIYYFSVINILFSVIATFYYLRITKIIFFENILVGNLYATISSKKVFIINLLTFLLIFLFFNPIFLYLYSYKMVLFLSKGFF